MSVTNTLPLSEQPSPIIAQFFSSSQPMAPAPTCKVHPTSGPTLTADGTRPNLQGIPHVRPHPHSRWHPPQPARYTPRQAPPSQPMAPAPTCKVHPTSGPTLTADGTRPNLQGTPHVRPHPHSRWHPPQPARYTPRQAPPSQPMAPAPTCKVHPTSGPTLTADGTRPNLQGTPHVRPHRQSRWHPPQPARYTPSGITLW